MDGDFEEEEEGTDPEFVMDSEEQVEDVSKTRGVSVIGDIQRADNSCLHFRSHGR